jgi:hypothetical protein
MTKEKQMYRVRIGCSDAQFPTLEEARAYAEKESYVRADEALILTPKGEKIRIKL